jgi:hypothetical protein
MGFREYLGERGTASNKSAVTARAVEQRFEKPLLVRRLAVQRR